MSMTKEEAIKILSKYDSEYYTPQHREAHRMAIDALRKQMERAEFTSIGLPMTPEECAAVEAAMKMHLPITMAELRQMNGETVYCLELNTNVKISAPKVGLIYVTYNIPGKYDTLKAMGLTLYRRKPEEENHG